MKKQVLNSEQPVSGKFGYLIGSDQNNRLVLPHEKRDVSVIGGTDIHELRTRQPKNYRLLHVPRNYFRQPVRHRLTELECLLNCVTDSDNNPRVLDNIERLIKSYKGRVINRPELVKNTSREKIAKLLSRADDIIVPRVLRLKKNNKAHLVNAMEMGAITFPIILRVAGTHSGEILGLCDTIEDAIRVIPEDQDCVATEYVDYRSNDGIYRKYRVFIIGSELILRHMIPSEQWNIHARDREIFIRAHPEAIAEWRYWCEHGIGALSERVVRSLHEIRKLVGLDFFGVDFGLAPDGRIILFEANATMNFFPFPPQPEYAFAKACLPLAQDAFNKLLYGANDSSQG